MNLKEPATPAKGLSWMMLPEIVTGSVGVSGSCTHHPDHPPVSSTVPWCSLPISVLPAPTSSGPSRVGVGIPARTNAPCSASRPGRRTIRNGCRQARTRPGPARHASAAAGPPAARPGVRRCYRQLALSSRAGCRGRCRASVAGLRLCRPWPTVCRQRERIKNTAIWWHVLILRRVKEQA